MSKHEYSHGEPLVVSLRKGEEIAIPAGIQTRSEVSRERLEEPRIEKKAHPKRNVVLPMVAVLILCILIGSSVLLWWYFSIEAVSGTYVRSHDSAASIPVAKNDVASLVEKVGKLILLPQGEIPTVAAVADLTPLKEQSFFKNAKKGDIVLMYARAKKAVLYDPSANIIIEVAPITTSQ